MRSLSFSFGGFLAGVLLAMLFPAAAVGGNPAPRVDLHGDPLPEGVLTRLGTSRFRHGNGASLAFAPDGKTILTFGGDRTIRYWDVATGRQVRERRVPGDLYSMYAGTFSPDGRRLAYLEDMKTFLLWDVAEHKLIRRLPLGEHFYTHAAFSPDSKTLVIANYSGLLTAWDVASGQAQVLGQHKRDLNTLSFATDGTLVTVCMNRELRICDLASGQLRSTRILPEHVYGAYISLDGRFLGVQSWSNPDKDKGVEFWDAVTGKPPEGWKVPDVKQVRAIQFTPDSKTAWIFAKNEVVQWDPAAGKALHTFSVQGTHRLAFSPDGKVVAAFGTTLRENVGGVLFVWTLTTGTTHAANVAERGHQGEVNGVTFSADGRMIATSSSGDRTVRLWEAGTGRFVRSFAVEHIVPRGVFFTSDGKHLITATWHAIHRWEIATGKQVGQFAFPEEAKNENLSLMRIHLADDGRTLLAAVGRTFFGPAGPGGPRKSRQSLLAWDVATGKLRQARPLPSDASPVGYYSSFSPDGRLLALTEGELHDAATGAKLQHFSMADLTPTMPLAFSRDGALLAMGLWRLIKTPEGGQRAESQGIQIWEVATASPITRLSTGEAAHGVFTPDGRGFITAGRDAITRWDLVSGRAVTRKPAHARIHGSYGPSFASSFALAADGRTVATGHSDTTALLWDMAAPLAAQAAAPLTAEQQEAAWTDLAEADAGRALAALAKLADVPEQTTTLLTGRLRSAQVPPAEELRQLIADLDAPQFDRREKATTRLMELGDVVEAALRDALKSKPSSEAQRRLETMLATPHVARTPEVRRHLRAVRLLEMISTAEARALLKKLSNGVAEARLTREAKAAAVRLERGQ